MVTQDRLRSCIQQGGLIAYPTEAMYGLGCSPFDSAAVDTLARLKERPSHKRFLLIASSFSQILPLIQPLTEEQHLRVCACWPGHITWVFQASDTAPAWLVTEKNTIAIRVTAHPIARQLCEDLQHPLVSTSANKAGGTPCTSSKEVAALFGASLDLIIEGPIGNQKKPSPLYDAVTGKRVPRGS